MWKVRDFRELILRCIFVVIFMGVILGISLNKIRVAFGFKDVDPLVSVTIGPPKVFPVWSSFMCGQNITKLVAEKLNKVANKAEQLPDHYISRTTTDSLTAGDWTSQTGSWPCFVFKPGNDIFFISGDIDQIILSAFVDEGMPVNSQSGLLFGIFDEQRNISMVEPFVSPTPSVNTFTFTRSQRIDVNEKLHSYFSVNKQNISPIFGGFDAKTMVAKFLYSPDTYLVFTFTEKRPYTPYDLLSAVGGLLTYSLAVWFILFGRGKYRSWGLVQRYLLRTSPDAMKKDDGDQLLSIPYDNTKDLEKQLNDGSTARRQHSLYYFSATGTPTQQNFSPSTTNSILASPSGKNLNKIIDARVNQKLWIVEQTLSRHYLSGFRLRSYDVDVKKFGYDGDDVTDNETLTPPTVHRNWNDVDSGGRGFGNPQMFPRGSQHLQKNHNNVPDSSNPEEQRPQYPIVTIGQVPSEKKHKGTASTSEIETAVISDGNNISNESSSTSAPSPSYLPDIPIQLQPRSNLA